MTLYVYAIVDEPAGIRGIEFFRVGKAWVAFAPLNGREAPAVSVEAAVAHDKIVRRIAKACAAVLPLRFGTVASDEKTLAKQLSPLAKSIAEALERVRDAVQLTIRVSGTPAPVKGGPGTKYLAGRAESVPEIAALTLATRALVRAARSERRSDAIPLSLGVPHPKPHFATVYHLVDRVSVAEWRRAVKKSNLDGVTVTVSGPWPPYAFAELL